MSEIMGDGAYEEVRKAHVGSAENIHAMKAFDEYYDAYAVEHGDEAARKLLFDELKEVNPTAYEQVMESMMSKMRSPEIDQGLRDVAAKAQKYHTESVPKEERRTF